LIQPVQIAHSSTKQKVAAINRRERISERWQALGVGPKRKVNIGA
jgi:hypothetical protein